MTVYEGALLWAWIHWHNIQWGDFPTWLAAIFGGGAALAETIQLVLLNNQVDLQRKQLADQQTTFNDEIDRNKKRDERLASSSKN